MNKVTIHKRTVKSLEAGDIYSNLDERNIFIVFSNNSNHYQLINLVTGKPEFRGGIKQEIIDYIETNELILVTKPITITREH